MSLIRAQVVFKGASNLPEDRFVNTFHFDGTPGGSYLTISGNLAEFYNGATTFPPGNLAQYMSEWILRSQAEIRCYDMSQAEPRVPWVMPWVLGARTESSFVSDLPEEVAVCCSFTGSPPITASRRGRIYLGPLNTLAISQASTTNPGRVDGQMIAALVERSEKLREDQADASAPWVIWSPTTSTMVPVVSGWVDNAIDTQRRRGPKASARTSWTSILP